MQSKPRRMTVSEFLAWADSTQPQGRYELVRGEIVAMAPERVRHAVIKGPVFRALGDAIQRAGVPCTAFPDGLMVVIDDDHAREPDVSVQCGALADLDSMVLDAPLIVVEVVSSSSERTDRDVKLKEYFLVPSIQHYLIVDPARKAVIHHARNPGGDIAERIASAGEIDLTPPGMKVPVAELLPEIG
ncbi:MAG TPA: Uma2 family endonuclease [Hyphomicrobiaceae bacterium]|nr:Uma2 family endonuclease [Hyphomicrobiaceae bacterium]